MLRLLYVVSLSLGLIPWPIFTASAQARCFPPAQALAALERYQETSKVFSGDLSDGARVEVYVSSPTSEHPGGTFTVLVRRPDGLVCFLASGFAWELIEAGRGT